MTPAESAVRVLAAIEAERMRREDAARDARAAWEEAGDALAGASRAVDRVLWAALTCFAVALVVAAHHLIGAFL